MAEHLKILLVEDEALIALNLKLGLQRAGHQVSLVSTGEKALASVALNRPDLIIMDKGLPGPLDGFETMRRIQAQDDIPVIFMTGYQDQAYQSAGQALHPLAYLVKPVEVEKLQQMIASMQAR